MKGQLPFYGTTVNVQTQGNESQIPEDIETYIKQFELENTTTPEQAQVFGNIIVNEINNLLELASISDADVSQNINDLRKIFEETVFYNSMTLIISEVAKTIAEGNILEDYEIDRWNELNSLPDFALSSFFSIYGGPEKDDFPTYRKYQMNKVNFAPGHAYEDSSGKKTNGMINFELVKQIAKDNYDFSKQTDENSSSIGMPQKAILQGLVSAWTQLFIGEAYAKGCATLAHFPKYVFNESTSGGFLSEYIAEIIKDYMYNKDVYTDKFSGWGHFSVAWDAMVTRLIAEKPEFTNLQTKKGALPGLPGEDDSRDNIVGLGAIDGTIYDVITGKEEIIKDHHQATKYFVRQNMPHPLSFVKKRLATVDYYGNLPADSESSPFDVLVYKNILEVHNEIVADVELTAPPQFATIPPDPDSIFPDAYEFLPDINEAEIINHFALVGKSSLFSAGTTDGSKEDFANGRFFYQYYFRIEDWESEEEAQENDGIYVENLVKRKTKGSGESSENLYGVLNRAGLLQILNNMYPAGENYDLTDYQTKEPIRKFFKSIKFGIRFCYGTVMPTYEQMSTQTQETKEMNNLLNETFKKIHQNPKGKEFCKREKIFKIVELDVNKATDQKLADGTWDFKQDKRISFIIPIKSHESNIDSYNIFGLSPAAFWEDKNEFTIEDWEEERKTLFNMVFQKLNGLDLSVAQDSKNMEFRSLFFYCIPVPTILSLFLAYNVALVSSDKDVNEAFDGTKTVIKDIFLSTYHTRGSEHWKQTPTHSSKRGGPLGIAVSSIENKV